MKRRRSASPLWKELTWPVTREAVGDGDIPSVNGLLEFGEFSDSDEEEWQMAGTGSLTSEMVKTGSAEIEMPGKSVGSQ